MTLKAWPRTQYKCVNCGAEVDAPKGSRGKKKRYCGAGACRSAYELERLATKRAIKKAVPAL